jgi:hypothetical protein
MLNLVGCGSDGTPPGAVVGRGGEYDYSPSVIQTGTEQKFWWCGKAKNPATSDSTDTILYESIDTVTHQATKPIVVLAESPNTWDEMYTCNPRVVQGSFNDPLGDGQNYTYEMFYVATAQNGTDNSIGAAFSNDGIHWNKYKAPVILSTSETGYGVGQPAVYNEDQKSRITMYYEDNTPTIHHIKATSMDGIHFTVQGTLTTNGLDPNNLQASWGDMGYDPSTGYWYAAFDINATRPPAITGGAVERGQYGIQLYRILDTSLLNGATPWEMLKTFDTNLTGNESNFLAGFLHDMYGNINIGPYPQIQLYPSISNPKPAWDASPESDGQSGNESKWDIGSATWIPNKPLMALNRYSNERAYEVTTGWIDPNANFILDVTLGHLYEGPQNGATLGFYGCKSGTTDYFVSLDFACGGQLTLGVAGFGYAQPVAGLNLVPLYSCAANDHSHFLSPDPNCESHGPGTLLGYALP